MARIRTIKPEFWTDEDMSEVSEPACLLAIGLLNYADDEGYFNANPKLIKAAVFPIREPSSSIPVLIRELSNCGYLSMFSTADGKHFGQIRNFKIHQVVNKSKASKIKVLDLIPYEYGTDTGQVPLGMDQGSGIRESKTPHIGEPEKSYPQEQEFVTPDEIPGVDEPIGKFAMQPGWKPAEDFLNRARLWGCNIPSDGYLDTELVSFVTYWQAEGKVFHNVQWEQKFARHVLSNRQKHGKVKPDRRSDPNDFTGMDYSVTLPGFSNGSR